MIHCPTFFQGLGLKLLETLQFSYSVAMQHWNYK